MANGDDETQTELEILRETGVGWGAWMMKTLKRAKKSPCDYP